MRRTDAARPVVNGERAKWPLWKRILLRTPGRVGGFIFAFFVSPFMTKHEDGTLGGSMKVWAVFLFTIAMVVRMIPIYLRTPDGTWIATMAPLSAWDVIAIFLILYALVLNKKLNQATASEVVGLLASTLPGRGRGADAPGGGETQVRVDPTPPAPSVTVTTTEPAPTIPPEEPET